MTQNVFKVGDLIRRKPENQTHVWLQFFKADQEFVITRIYLDEVWIEGSPFGWILDRFELVSNPIDLDEDDQDCI